MFLRWMVCGYWHAYESVKSVVFALEVTSKCMVMDWFLRPSVTWRVTCIVVYIPALRSVPLSSTSSMFLFAQKFWRDLGMCAVSLLLKKIHRLRMCVFLPLCSKKSKNLQSRRRYIPALCCCVSLLHIEYLLFCLKALVLPVMFGVSSSAQRFLQTSDVCFSAPLLQKIRRIWSRSGCLILYFLLSYEPA